MFFPVNVSSSSSFSVQGSVFRRIDALLGEFRVGGGVHDSYTFQCGLVGYFTSSSSSSFLLCRAARFRP